jgi:hypothetical protein
METRQLACRHLPRMESRLPRVAPRLTPSSAAPRFFYVAKPGGGPDLAGRVLMSDDQIAILAVSFQVDPFGRTETLSTG